MSSGSDLGILRFLHLYEFLVTISVTLNERHFGELGKYALCCGTSAQGPAGRSSGDERETRPPAHGAAGRVSVSARRVPPGFLFLWFYS